MTNPKATGRHREEANVELDLRLPGPLSDDALDEYSDQIVGALAQHAPGIVLGPAVLIEVDDCVISLQFDVPATTAAELHRHLSTALEIIERDTHVTIDRIKTDSTFTELDVARPADQSTDQRAAG